MRCGYNKKAATLIGTTRRNRPRKSQLTFFGPPSLVDTERMLGDWVGLKVGLIVGLIVIVGAPEG